MSILKRALSRVTGKRHSDASVEYFQPAEDSDRPPALANFLGGSSTDWTFASIGGGGGKTPAQIANAISAADAGSPAALIAIANDCRKKDPTLQSALRMREQMVSLLPYSVSAYRYRGERDPREEDEKVAEFVEEALDKAGYDQRIRGFQELVDHLQGATFHGFAVAQTVWRQTDEGFVPLGWILHSPSLFRFRPSDGKLVYSGDGYSSEGVDFQALWPGAFIVHQPRLTGETPSREGLSRLLVWSSTFRNWANTDWLKTAEMTWKPFVRAYYAKDNAGKHDRETLRRSVSTMLENGVVIHRDDQGVDLMWPGGKSSSTGGGSHAALLAFHGNEISKAVIHGTLTNDAGSRGARNLGLVHKDNALLVRESDALSTDRTLRRDLIKWIVNFNFDGANICKTGFDTAETSDIASFGKGIRDLREAGYQIKQSFVDDHTGQTAIQEGDLLLGGRVHGEPEIDIDLTELEETPNESTEESEQ